MERKCRELLLFILSPAMLFNFQNLSRFYFGRKNIKNFKKIASAYYTEKSISKSLAQNKNSISISSDYYFRRCNYFRWRNYPSSVNICKGTKRTKQAYKISVAEDDAMFVF